MSDRSLATVTIIAFLMSLASMPLPAQETSGASEWRRIEGGPVSRLRLSPMILDSEMATLEVELADSGRVYGYSVDWGDGSEAVTGSVTGGRVRLEHDYDLISTFRVVVSLTSGGEEPGEPEAGAGEPKEETESAVRVEAGLVTVVDDDDSGPFADLDLPPPVIRPGDPAVVRWKITDESGVDYARVVIQGPEGPIAEFDEVEGEFDLDGLGLGTFGIEVQSRDLDADRPDDELGFMVIETVVVTDDLDDDGILDYLDTCPRRSNPDQADRDGDGLGDVCDPCPDVNGRCDPDSPPAIPEAEELALMATPAVIGAGPVPVIASVTPSSTLVGEPVVIKGSDFGDGQGAAARVTFGGVDAGTVLHWTDTRITVEVPVGSLSGTAPTPTPKGLQPVVVRTAGGVESAPFEIDIVTFNTLVPYSRACRCGDPGCSVPCLPDDYCGRGLTAGGCIFDGEPYDRRDIKDVDFGDIDDDGDLDILDVSSPMQAGDPATPGAQAGFSPAGCGDPVNFPDRVFVNDGSGGFTDITGGADADYDTTADNPLDLFHSFRTYDADFVDVNNDGFLDLVRADRALCAGDPAHYFLNVDTSGDGVPDNEFQGMALGVPTQDAYWDNLATGDVDGDGDLDLLISHSAATTAPHALQLNSGSGIFTQYNPAVLAPTHGASDDFLAFEGRAHDMALVDLDDDRDLDIVIGGGNHGSGGTNFVMLSRLTETGELFFEEIPIPNAAESSATVHVGTPDLNGDGRRDVHFVNDYWGIGPADRLFLNLGPVGCGSAAESVCPDGLTCAGAGQLIANRICWSDSSPRVPEEVAGNAQDGYGADYGDIDGDGDLDILVTGLDSGGNYLFVNRGFSTCKVSGDCPSGYACVDDACQPQSASTPVEWWSCPTLAASGGGTSVPCRDREGNPVVGPQFPVAKVNKRSLSVVFGDVNGDVDLEILWARGQWSDWAVWPDAGPLLLVPDNVPPSVDAGPDQLTFEDESVDLEGATFSDPGVLDTHTATIDWGDGSPPNVGTVTPQGSGGLVDGSHTYTDPGVYTVTVTVTDNEGASGSDTKTIRVVHGFLSYCFFGEGTRPWWDRVDVRKRVMGECDVASHSRVRLKRRVRLAGDIVSLDQEVRVGKDDFLEGDVLGLGPVKLKRRSRLFGDATAGLDLVVRRRVSITGDATAGGTVDLEPTATVGGAVTSGAAVSPLPPITTVSLALTAGGADVSLARNETRVLAPGSYGDLEMDHGSILDLTAGHYRFESFTVRKDTQIRVDLSAADQQLLVDITGHMRFGRRSELRVVSATGDASDILFQVDYSRRLRLKKGSRFAGTILAPLADIKLGRWAHLEGALYGLEVNAKKGASMDQNPAVEVFASVYLP